MDCTLFRHGCIPGRLMASKLSLMSLHALDLDRARAVFVVERDARQDLQHRYLGAHDVDVFGLDADVLHRYLDEVLGDGHALALDVQDGLVLLLFVLVFLSLFSRSPIPFSHRHRTAVAGVVVLLVGFALSTILRVIFAVSAILK